MSTVTAPIRCVSVSARTWATQPPAALIGPDRMNGQSGSKLGGSTPPAGLTVIKASAITTITRVLVAHGVY